MPLKLKTKPNLKALREQRQELLDEANGINDKCKAESREPTADEQKRFDTIMKVELPEADRAVNLAEADSEALQQEALDRYNARNSDGESSMRFRDATTGQEIRTLAHDEPILNLQNPDRINDSHFHPERDGGVSSDLPRVGDLLQAMVTGSTLPDGRTVQAALGGVDPDGGFLLNPTMGGMFIDLARSASVAMRAGAMTLAMPSREVHIVGAETDPTAQWRPEGALVKSSDATFYRRTLTAKTLACIVPVTIELLEDAANIASVLEAQIEAAMGLMLDQAILRGSGAESEPRGVVNQSGVNTVAAVGTPTSYASITSAVGKILNNNFSDETDNIAWIMNPRDWQTFDGLTATDGQPLMPTPWASSLQRLSTTSMPTDLGDGSDESEAIVGDFRQAVVGMRTTGINIRVLDAGPAIDEQGNQHHIASNLERMIVAYLRADVALLRPSWFTVLSGITAA